MASRDRCRRNEPRESKSDSAGMPTDPCLVASQAQCRDVQIQYALVLGSIGVSLGENIVAPGPVSVELAAGTRSAGYDELSIPGTGKAKQEPSFLGGITREPAFRLDAGHGSRRKRRTIGNHTPVGDGSDSAGAPKHSR